MDPKIEAVIKSVQEMYKSLSAQYNLQLSGWEAQGQPLTISAIAAYCVLKFMLSNLRELDCIRANTDVIETISRALQEVSRKRAFIPKPTAQA